jgi:hypothetical protein
MQSSPSPSSSSASLFSSLFPEDDVSANTSPERPARLPIRKRPRLSNLRHYQSTPAVPSQSTSAPNSPSKQGIPSECSPTRGRTQRRCVSADNANRARSWFTSPDRFVSSRSPRSPESPVHLGRPVPKLTPRERYDRQRDNSISPFRLTSTSRSRSIAARRPINPNRRLSPPQYTPSFIHGTVALPRDTGPFVPRITPRQISDGAVWNVGGPAAAQIAPPTATADGRGGLLSSGTNAPLYVAHFLDHETSDQGSRRHEDRLALALEVDPATRILSNIRPELMSRRDHSADRRSYDWRNNAWTRGDYQQRKFGIHSHRKRRSRGHSAIQLWTLSNWYLILTLHGA